MTASGELIFNIFSSLAQFERRLIQDAGLDSARARGRKGGRKNIAHDDPRVLTAKRMHKNHGMSIDKMQATQNLESQLLTAILLCQRPLNMTP